MSHYRPYLITFALGIMSIGCDDPRREAVRELKNRQLDATPEGLAAAAGEGNEEGIRLLLQAGVDVSARNSGGNTALHVAVQKGAAEAVGQLVSAGARLDEASDSGVTPVALAAVQKQHSLLEQLLAAGAKPQGKTPEGDEVLAWAITHHQTETVKALLKAGADPAAMDAKGTPAIYLALEKGQVEIAAALLQAMKPGAVPRNAQGETVLEAALRLKRASWVKTLVQAGASPEESGRDGLPIFEIAAREDESFARELARAGATPAEGTWSAAMWKALENGDCGRLRVLLSAGARPGEPREDGLLPAGYALQKKDASALHLLLSYGASTAGLLEQAAAPEQTNLYSLLLAHGGAPPPFVMPSLDTPLGQAIRSGDTRRVRMLLDYGASPITPTGEGQSPLALAITLEHPDIVKELIGRGADPNAALETPSNPDFLELVQGGMMKWLLRNDLNVSPLMLAADTGNLETARVLLKSGAKTSSWTRRNRIWPLNIAARKEDVRMMRMIMGKDPVMEPRRIVVDLSDQKAWVYDSSGQELLVTKVSTGKPGHPTPTGTFAITNKYREWRSTLYPATMPYFQRLSCSDFGFHQGVVPGRPASHGCIRVPDGVATRLFALTELGDRVIIQQ